MSEPSHEIAINQSLVSEGLLPTNEREQQAFQLFQEFEKL